MNIVHEFYIETTLIRKERMIMLLWGRKLKLEFIPIRVRGVVVVVSTSRNQADKKLV